MDDGAGYLGAWTTAIAGKPAPTLECISEVGAGLPAMTPIASLKKSLAIPHRSMRH
ncbi:hypothetical protein METHPM2_1770008 [Pseudomonas sp. PM2]